MSKANATHTWIADGIELDVACNGGNVYLPTDDQADPSTAPKATYEVADYDEAGNEVWTVLVGGRATTGRLVPLADAQADRHVEAEGVDLASRDERDPEIQDQLDELAAADLAALYREQMP